MARLPSTLRSMFRWELIFWTNIILAAVFPLFCLIKRANKVFIVLGTFAALCGIHFALYLCWLISASGDFLYFSWMYWLHLGPSLVCLSLILFSVTDLKSPALQFAATLFSSLALSVLFFLLTPSLSGMDPFWGIVPGAVDMDPIIDLNFYWLRLWASLAAWILIFGLGYRFVLGPFKILGIIWVSFLVACQIQAGPYSIRYKLEKHFSSAPSGGRIQIFSNQPDDIRKIWLQEFEFLQTEILKRLPHSENIDFSDQLAIFIFENDHEKKLWIGAERTQIGNFLRSEMHLSELELDSPVLEHELTHLIHGTLDAPLKTYLDPFWFEGLAVGATEIDEKKLARQAAALFRVFVIQGRPLEWPHFTDFFSGLPPAASYRLAGAYANIALSQSLWPWDAPKINPDVFKGIEVSDEDLSEASQILSMKPLAADPLRRDCARIYRSYKENPDLESYRSLLEICDRSPLAYEALFLLSEDRELAMRLLAESRFPNQNLIHADLDAASGNPQISLKIYDDCETSDCKLKAKLVKNRRLQDLQKILLVSHQPRLDLRRAFLPDPQSVKELNLMLPLSERVLMFQSVQKLRKLTQAEAFLFLKARIYSALSHGMKSEQRKDFFKELQTYSGENAERLRRRLSFR